MNKPLKVLLIEDSENDATLILQELRRGGFNPYHRQVETADSMRAALCEVEWDIILSDYTMPNFNLMSAIKVLKEEGYEIPLIVVSGTIGEERAVETLKAGAQDYLLKESLVRLCSCVNNILNEARARREAQIANHLVQKLSQVVKQTADAVFITDINGVIEYANPAFECMSGYHSTELIGHDTRFLKSGHHDEAFYHSFWETVLQGKTFHGTFVNRGKDGALFYEEKVVTPLIDENGEIAHFVSTGRDISERIDYENKLRHQATHDYLTGLPNRVLLEDRLRQAIAFAERNQHMVSVIFIDLDNFKRINDAYGHGTGDRLLHQVAQELERCCRESDTLGRLGGDEFVIVLGKLSGISDAYNMLDRLKETFSKPYLLDGTEVFVTASIGLSVYPEDCSHADGLLQNADAAMYRVKETGKNGFQLYSPDMNAKHRERLSLENALRHALELEQFVVYYQPQINITSGEIFGVEALLRWQHPDRGLVPPANFISILEETGLILPVGDWVLQAACKQKQLWNDMGLNLNVAVNISGRQFATHNLVRHIRKIVTEVCSNIKGVELEITESVVMSDAASSITILRDISEMGIQLAIDDFGTGYSSLSYLRRLPIHTLKIDASFVNDIGGHDNHGSGIVAAIISMAETLGLSTVAEGVETAEQLDFLAEHGCNYAQGYYYSKPVSAEQLKPYLMQRSYAS